LLTVSGNRSHSRTHRVDLAGYSWVRLRATAGNPDNDPGNADAEFQLDVHDAHLGNTDSWAFLGDSITAGGMGHDPSGGQNFAERVAAATGNFPAYECAGIGYDTAIGQGLGRLTYLLANSEAKYIGIAYGTNDGAGNPASDYAFYDAYAAMIDAALADGRTPVIPTIPYSNDPAHNTAIGDPALFNGGSPLPADRYLLNVQLEKLKADYRAQGKIIVDGPDLWAYFCAHPDEIEAGYVHPTEAGYLAYRNLWADAAVANLYQAP
jgi:lysophospholipase L1-like esterase